MNAGEAEVRFKALLQSTNFTLRTDATLNIEIH